MKKIIISILATMCVMAIVCFGIIQNITAQHEAELADVKFAQEVLVQELREGYRTSLEEKYELETQVEDLENGFYRMMNDEDFEVTIEHDDARYEYVSEKDGWFRTIKAIETKSVDN